MDGQGGVAGSDDAVKGLPGGGGAAGGGADGPAPLAAADGHRSEAYSFDSTALERAAKAAKVRISK